MFSATARRARKRDCYPPGRLAPARKRDERQGRPALEHILKFRNCGVARTDPIASLVLQSCTTCLRATARIPSRVISSTLRRHFKRPFSTSAFWTSNGTVNCSSNPRLGRVCRTRASQCACSSVRSCASVTAPSPPGGAARSSLKRCGFRKSGRSTRRRDDAELLIFVNERPASSYGGAKAVQDWRRA